MPNGAPPSGLHDVTWLMTLFSALGLLHRESIVSQGCKLEKGVHGKFCVL